MEESEMEGDVIKQMIQTEQVMLIAGKTHFEILAMERKVRSRWYATISQKDKKEAMRIVDIVGRIKMSAANKGKKRTKEFGAKLKAWWTLERRAALSAVMMGRYVSEETREKFRGKNNSNFNNWASRTPYCHLFDENRKEYIRNLYNRICTVCGKSTLQNIDKKGKWLGRLAVDHVDENKMQGCDDWEWRLAPLCHHCHCRMNKRESHFLLHFLLLSNKRYQINLLFGE